MSNKFSLHKEKSLILGLFLIPFSSTSDITKKHNLIHPLLSCANVTQISLKNSKNLKFKNSKLAQKKNKIHYLSSQSRLCEIQVLTLSRIMDHSPRAQSLASSEINKVLKEYNKRLKTPSLTKNFFSNDSVLKKEVEAVDAIRKIASRMQYATRCERQFVKKEGFGPLGLIVKETLSGNAAAGLINQNISFNGSCPGYREMNLEQRKNLWVFVMMSMAHYESSCKTQATNQGPYGQAMGLLQLHDQKENIYVSWDPDLNCDKGVSHDSRKSLKCALTMIGNSLYKGSPFFDDGSHWQVLRQSQKPGSQAYRIRYALSQIPDCKANPLYFDVNLNFPSKAPLEARNQSRPLPTVELALYKFN